MTDRSVGTLATLGIVVYVGLVGGLAFGAAQIPGNGWRPGIAFVLVCAVGALAAFAFRHHGRRLGSAMWVVVGAVALAALGVTFVPSNDGAREGAQSPQEVRTEATLAPSSSVPSVVPTPSTKPSLTSSPQPALTSEPKEVGVRIGTATRLFRGDFRLGASSVYEDYAAMGMYTPRTSCTLVIVNVGQTVTMRDAAGVAYSMTLLSVREGKSVVVEASRLPTDTELSVSCP